MNLLIIAFCIFVLFTVVYSAALMRANRKQPEYESPARTCKSPASNTPYIIKRQRLTAWDSASLQRIRRSILANILAGGTAVGNGKPGQDRCGRIGSVESFGKSQNAQSRQSSCTAASHSNFGVPTIAPNSSNKSKPGSRHGLLGALLISRQLRRVE